MFGPAFLVCPVTRPMYYDKGSVALQDVEKTRVVYLPEGADWVDFWSGKKYRGGRDVKADAPIDKIPLFVRQGSIVPMGPVVQHTGELPGKELTIVVYPGRDAVFTLYEDEGDNRGVSRPSGWNGTIAGVYCPSGSAKVRFPVWRSPASSAWSWAAVRTRCSVKGRAWKSVTTGRPRNAVCEVNGIVENNSCKGNTV